MKIILRQTPFGWRVRYVAENREILASTEDYTTKQSANNVIGLLQRSHTAVIIVAPPGQGLTPENRHSLKFHIWRSALSGWRWQYRAGNGEPLAWGEGYQNWQDCFHCICLIRLAYKAPVHEIPRWTPIGFGGLNRYTGLPRPAWASR